jgi:hypothetical protein
MAQYNGVSLLTKSDWALPDSVLATDACLSGIGGTLTDQCFHAPFPLHILQREMHISGLEALAVSVALKLWAPLLSGMRVRILCDNQATVQVINFGKAKDAFLLQCMREICFTSAMHRFQVKAVHISGVENRLPDFISRWDSDPQAPASFYSTPGAPALTIRVVPEHLFDFSHNW